MPSEQKFLLKPKLRRWLLDATIMDMTALKQHLDAAMLIDFFTGNPDDSNLVIRYENYHKIMFVPVRVESRYIFGVGFETTNISANLNSNEKIESFRFVIDMSSNEMFFIRIYSNRNVMSCYTTLQPGVVLLNFNTYAVQNWSVKLLSKGSLDSRMIGRSGSNVSGIPLLALKHSIETNIDDLNMNKYDSVVHTDSVPSVSSPPSPSGFSSALTGSISQSVTAASERLSALSFKSRKSASYLPQMSASYIPSASALRGALSSPRSLSGGGGGVYEGTLTGTNGNSNNSSSSKSSSSSGASSSSSSSTALCVSTTASYSTKNRGFVLNWKSWFQQFLSNYGGKFNMVTEVVDANGVVLVPPDKLYFQENACRGRPDLWQNDFTSFLNQYYVMNPKVYTRGIVLAGGSYLTMGGLETIEEAGENEEEGEGEEEEDKAMEVDGDEVREATPQAQLAKKRGRVSTTT